MVPTYLLNGVAQKSWPQQYLLEHGSQASQSRQLILAGEPRQSGNGRQPPHWSERCHRRAWLRSRTCWVRAALDFLKPWRARCGCEHRARFSWLHGPAIETSAAAAQAPSAHSSVRPALPAPSWPVQPLECSRRINHTSSIPGYRTNLAFLAGSGGANGVLTLRDRFGVQTATADTESGSE